MKLDGYDIATDDYVKAVAANVAAAVENALASGWLMRTIEERSGLSQSALNRMPKGQQLTLRNIRRLALGLGIPVETLTSTETDAARAALETT